MKLRWIAVTALVAASTVVLAPANPAAAASADGFATGWVVLTGNPTADYFPPYVNPTDPSNPLGPSDNFCQDSTFATNVFELTFGSLPIPGGATITGIEVTIDAGIGAGDSPDVTLTNGSGTNKSDTKNFTPPSAGSCAATSNTVLGSPTDDWNTTLTAADIAAGNFGVKIAGAIFMDSINFKVYFGNGAPTADAGGPYMVNEGASVALDGSGSSDPDGDPLTYSWDLNNDGTFGDATGVAPTFSAAGRNGPDSQTVALEVNDGTVDSDPDTAIVTIKNVAPTITIINLSAASIDEGDSVTVSGTFSDPGTGETYTGTALWSDGASTPVAITGTSFSTSRTFVDDDPTATASDTFTVDITIDDGDGGSDTDTSPTLTVNNVDPVLGPLSLSSAAIDEDGSVTLTGSFTDVGVADTHTVTVDWGEGAPEAATVTQGAGSGTFTATHQYLDDDPTATPADTYTITVTVADDDTGSDTGAASVTVDNVDPVITAIASSATFDDKAGEGETVTVSGTFTDAGTLDTHTATIDWDDGTVTPATVVQATGGGTFSGDHAYAAGGVYTVTVTLVDDDTGSTSTSVLAVVSGVGVNGGVLQVVGTNGADLTHVKRVKGEIDVFADFLGNQHRRYDLASVSSIEIWLCDGDDHGNVHPSIDLPATIHGGDGNDMLWGGSGPDVIEGEDGDDKLWGRNGDDELYGGPGDDNLQGGKGTDLLDGGPGNNKLKQ